MSECVHVYVCHLCSGIISMFTSKIVPYVYHVRLENDSNEDGKVKRQYHFGISPFHVIEMVSGYSLFGICVHIQYSKMSCIAGMTCWVCHSKDRERQNSLNHCCHTLQYSKGNLCVYMYHLWHLGHMNPLYVLCRVTLMHVYF